MGDASGEQIILDIFEQISFVYNYNVQATY